MGTILAGAGYLLLAAPVLGAAYLAFGSIRGERLPRSGATLIYLGCLAWVLFLTGKAAFSESWRPWIGAPVAVGALLGTAWALRERPGRSALSAAGDAGVFLVVSVLLWVSVGGGYFDGLFRMSRAHEALEARGIRSDDAAALTAALGDPDVWVRYGAAAGLRSFREKAAPAALPLIKELDDADLRAAGQARSTLYGLGPLPAEAAPLLAAKLRDKRWAMDAGVWLRGMGKDGLGALPVLVEELEGTDAAAREGALDVIAALGPAAASAAAPVLERLAAQPGDALFRGRVQDALKKLGR
ncbi:MAG: hypothetical protein KGL53_01715 [Elusimicrobia bacterium]|nr:hypothetical protein [Elusimicrobiota bacterium]